MTDEKMRKEFLDWLQQPVANTDVDVYQVLIGNCDDDAWWAWQASAAQSAETIARQSDIIAGLELELGRMKSAATFANDVIARLEEELAALRAQVAELQAKLDTAIDALDGANEGIARRQSRLDEAAKQKPVGVGARWPEEADKRILYLLWTEGEIEETEYAGMEAVKLYALPPNLPAIIEQAKRDENNACAAIATAAKEHHDKYDIAAAIRARGEKK